MTTTAPDPTGRSYDDQPETAVRTVLAVPVRLPPHARALPATEPVGAAPAGHGSHRRRGPTGRRRASRRPLGHSRVPRTVDQRARGHTASSAGLWPTVRVGLSAAVAVFLAMTGVLLVAELLVR